MGDTITIDNATRDQQSLMLYFETTLVEHGGTVESIRMNQADHENVPQLIAAGLVEKFERVPAKLLGSFHRGITHTVDFTEAGWSFAHALRRARAARCLTGDARKKIDALRQERSIAEAA